MSETSINCKCMEKVNEMGNIASQRLAPLPRLLYRRNDACQVPILALGKPYSSPMLPLTSSATFYEQSEEKSDT